MEILPSSNWSKVRVYKKQCNVGVVGYMFKQEDIMFCDYNYTGLELVSASVRNNKNNMFGVRNYDHDQKSKSE